MNESTLISEKECKQDHLLREVRKLLSILNTMGNTLVPTIEGQKQTFATERLDWAVSQLKNDYSLSLDEIEIKITELN